MADRPGEADVARAALTRAASEIEFRDGRQPWVDDGLAALESLERRLSDYEQALREIVTHDGHHATESCVPQMVAVARAALSSDHILTKDGTDSN